MRSLSGPRGSPAHSQLAVARTGPWRRASTVRWALQRVGQAHPFRLGCRVLVLRAGEHSPGRKLCHPGASRQCGAAMKNAVTDGMHRSPRQRLGSTKSSAGWGGRRAALERGAMPLTSARLQTRRRRAQPNPTNAAPAKAKLAGSGTPTAALVVSGAKSEMPVKPATDWTRGHRFQV